MNVLNSANIITIQKIIYIIALKAIIVLKLI